MGAKRIELTGFSDTEVEQLKSFGFFGEIVAWRLWLFLPLEAQTGTEGPVTPLPSLPAPVRPALRGLFSIPTNADKAITS
jgi:hypothetical protein